MPCSVLQCVAVWCSVLQCVTRTEAEKNQEGCKKGSLLRYVLVLLVLLLLLYLEIQRGADAESVIAVVGVGMSVYICACVEKRRMGRGITRSRTHNTSARTHKNTPKKNSTNTVLDKYALLILIMFYICVSDGVSVYVWLLVNGCVCVCVYVCVCVCARARVCV